MSETRRAFLGMAGAACGAVCAGGCFGGAFRSGGGARPTRRRAASDRLAVGVIGVGGRGMANWEAAYRAGESIVALCDVDETALFAARDILAERCPGVRLYRDFRVMFEMEKTLDAVFISTPDHGHGLQAAWALGHGCHLYVETPLVRTLDELRELHRRAREAGVCVQMGNQGSALDGFRRAVEVLRAGVIGRVSEAHVWTTRPVWPQGLMRPDGSDPVPPTLDWELWLGPAPACPYKNKAYHRFNWRGWFDFGTGALGDGGGHLLNLPFRALGLEAAQTAEAVMCEGTTAESYPKASRVRFTFAARNAQPEMTLVWYDGGRKPPSEVMPPGMMARDQVPDTGCLLIGEKGVWLAVDDLGKNHRIALRGESQSVDADSHEACAAVLRTLPRAEGHQQEFLSAVHSGTPLFSGLPYAVPLMETVLAGCVAQRVPGRLEWSSRKGRFLNSPLANGLMTPNARDGWTYPGERG